MANKRVLVDPPPFTPLRFGLLSAATDRTVDAPSHWAAGVTWQSHCPGVDGTYDECLTVTRDGIDPTTVDETPPEPPAKTPTTEFLLRGATPFTVLARFDCSPVGFWDRAQALAAEALTRAETFRVERIFSTGVAPVAGGAAETAYPHLQATQELIDDTGAMLQSEVDVVSASTLDIVEGLGVLESALSDCYHGQGVLHVPAVLGPALANSTLVTRQGDALFTLNGNRVALGSGYPGAAPDGALDDGVAWIYATGSVFYYRGNVTVTQITDSFNRANNTVEAYAERHYVIGWDCCHLAVPIATGGITVGDFGEET